MDNSTKASTAFGTLISIFVNLSQDDLIKTVVLAAVGGASSYLATLAVKKAVLITKKYLHRKLW